ncbi:MAG: AAA family ATPase [Candidatus Hodarchaeota archaeon]
MVFQFCIILCGLPASGKSTFAKQLDVSIPVHAPFKQLEIVDIDLLRSELSRKTGTSDDFQPEQERALRNEKIKKIEHLLDSGSNVIDDDLNYFRSMRRETAGACLKQSAFYVIIHVNTPLDVCLSWNEGRPDPIPGEVITRVNDKFDPPGSRNYTWDKFACSINPAEDDIEKRAEEVIAMMTRVCAKVKEKNEMLSEFLGNLDEAEKISSLNLANLDDTIGRATEKKVIGNHADTTTQDFDIATRRLIHDFIKVHGPLQKSQLDIANRMKKDALKEVKKHADKCAEKLEKIRDYLNSLVNNA